MSAEPETGFALSAEDHWRMSQRILRRVRETLQEQARPEVLPVTFDLRWAKPLTCLAVRDSKTEKESRG